MATQVKIGKAKDPSKTSSAHDVMAPRLSLVNTLMEGTTALRHAAETYLPRFTAEGEQNYQDRLKRSVLVNYFRRSIESLVGKPFSTAIIIGPDMPPELNTLCEDIDRQGNNLDVFARKSFRDALTKGITHILVEFPVVVEAPTLEDERNIGATPYFVFIPPESILAAYCEYRNGEEFLTHVRIYETETQRVDFDEITIERVRVLEPGTWTIWRKHEKRWEVEDSGNTSLDYIPLVTIYFDREDFMVARPPMEDLAHVNIAHWQSGSDQANILTVARFPILAASGVSEEEAQIKIGPKQLLTTISKDGKYYYVEHSGAAIEAGRKDLKDMEEQMSILGIELLKKSGDATATAKAIDTAENLSMLQAFTILFIDGVEKAFGFAAKWMNLASGGSLKINTDFGLKMGDPTDLIALQWARQMGEISHEQYIIELQRRGTLEEDYDAEADAILIDAEKQKDLVDQAFQMKLQQEGTLPPPTPGVK